MYYLKLNGIKYAVDVDASGNTTYDPPLPAGKSKKWKHNIKDMCASGKAPCLFTDTSFHAGRGTLLQQMDGDEIYCDYLVKKAKEQGYTPGANDIYIGQMADKDGHPDAWLKPGEGRAELKKRLIASGKGGEMAGMSVKAKPYEKKKSTPINKRAMKGLAQHYKSTGEAAGMSQSELKQHIVKNHSLNS